LRDDPASAVLVRAWFIRGERYRPLAGRGP